MDVAALVESESHVCCRYRLVAFAPALAAAGHTLTFVSLPPTLRGRWTLPARLAGFDAVVLQRKLLPRWLLARVRRAARRLVFDFDDAVWLRDSYSPKGFDDARRLARFAATVAASDAVVAGNDYLAAAARDHAGPAARVTVIPTCVDLSVYAPHSYSPLTPHPLPLQLVWVGSSSTLKGLERFTPTLSAVGRAAPGTRLKLVCDRFIRIPDLPVDECRWAAATEAADIGSADVGVGWVPDDPWSRGKCGLKVLQYQAAGLPVVANPVGVHPDMVRPGGTGFLATTTAEWVDAVRALAADPGLRARLGAAGRQLVRSRYDVPVGAAAWVRLLDGLAAKAAA